MILDGLLTGGIERVGSDYLKIFKELGYDVDVYNLNKDLTEMEQEYNCANKIYTLTFSRNMAPERYAVLIKRNKALLYSAIHFALTIFDEFYKAIVRIKHHQKYDVVIAFSGHYNDLTFVAKQFLKSKKKLCWLHGALYSYLLISDGYAKLYNKIENLIVLNDDAQDEALMYNKNLKLNINKIYNPTYILNKSISETNVSKIKKKYGDYILMVSRFEYPHKDHYTVLSALKILKLKYNLIKHLVLVGSGTEEKKVKQFLLEECPDILPYVHFLGTIDNVQDYYSSAHLLVHASVAGEGLPTILLEALAYKLPIVVTDSKVGPREILKDNEYGLLCKVKNPHDMAEKIFRMYTETNLYLHYKEKSSERLKDFKPETIKKQVKFAIENLK